IDTAIRANSACELLQCFENARLLIVDRDVGACTLARDLETIRKAIDRDYALCTKQLRACDSELSNRTTSPHGDRITGCDVAHLRTHVARGEDVTQKKNLFIRQTFRNFQRS